ncbi:MAG TPA: SMC family ATPase [Oculatellaceae cyanobacterium]
MLLQRISLLNFLSHRGISNGSTKLAPIEIDLRSSPLWLIYGSNGSGKSSIFDAITFALFKQHRGSGSANHGAAYLITDGENEARVELEIVLNGKSYLIQRELKRSKVSSSVTVSGIVLEWDGKNWIAVKNTKNKVESWVQKNLRMGVKTFTSAVLLQQGEADAFLKAKPTDRKERLLEILDLDFYKRLGDTVASRKTDARNEWKQVEQKISTMKKVDRTEIEKHNKVIEEITQGFSDANKLTSDKESELKDAMRTLNIQEDIREKEKDKKQAERLIAREGQIVANFKRFRELESDIPVIRNILEISSRLEQEIGESARISKSINASQVSLADLSIKVKTAQKDTNAAEKDCDKVRERLEKAQGERDTLKGQVDQISQIETLASLLADAKARLVPYQDILQHAEELDTEKQRYDELKNILPVLDDLSQARVQSINIDKDKAKLQNDLSNITKQLDSISSQFQLEQKRLLTARKTREKLSSSFEKLQSQIAELRRRIAEREDVSHKQECPVCGSPLDSDEAHSRIDVQIESWKKDLVGLLRENKNTNANLRDGETELASAESSVEKLGKSRTKLETSKSVLTSKNSSLVEQERENKKQIKKLETRAGVWSQEIDNINVLRQELYRSGKNSKQWEKLDLARKEVTKQQTIITARESDLDRLPKWTALQREKIKSSHEEIIQLCTSLQDDLKQADRYYRQYQKTFTDLQQDERSIAQDIEHLQDSLKGSDRRKSNEEEKLTKKLGGLPERLHSQIELMDMKELTKLERERDTLSGAEEADTELRNARKEVDQIEGSLVQLKKQLQEIPKEYQRPVDKVRSEFEAAQNSAQALQAKLNLANEELGKMRSAKQEYDLNIHAYEVAKTKLRYFDKLSSAFGRSGLQAQIVQEAQKRIKDAANATLGYLSNGCWRIELSGDDQELEILAQDLSKPGLPIRRFEYLSGGEKFRVAISLAVAIGQSISGGRTVDTLIIDEGFGSLDEVNRDNLVAELRRLSDEVLNGGRVVIVSHEEDICEEFAHRLKISKNAEGFVSVEQYIG